MIIGSVVYQSTVRPNLKICWFAVLLPTHPKQALPKIFYCLSENLFLFKFFSNSVNKPFFKIIKSCILIEEMLQTVIICILTLYTAFVDL